MKLILYLKSRLAELILSFLLFIFLTVFTGIAGMSPSLRQYILLTTLLFLTDIIMAGYLPRARFYKTLLKTLHCLDKKYLLCEMVSPPSFPEGRILTAVLQITGKSMNDAIAAARDATSDYREYIETWVHEIKTPIASARLMADNTGNIAVPLSESLTQIENYVMQALFYARSESLENDYLIREVTLSGCVNPVLRENARTFILNHARVHTGDLSATVRTDPKWIHFILRQILDNAVKYCGSEPPDITISSLDTASETILTIADQGTGILPEDLPRVFDKGFTGMKGHQDKSRATGIGLYLCHRLCCKMAVPIDIHSEYGKGTTVSLHFPH